MSEEAGESGGASNSSESGALESELRALPPSLTVIGALRSRIRGARIGGVAAGVLLLGFVLSVLSPEFLRFGNLLDVSRQMSIIGLMAIGLTFVLVSGQIDLSVGSVFGLASVLAAWILVHGGGIPLAITAAVLVGAGAGLINGILSAYLGLPSFIVTLGMLQVLRGIALLITNGAPLGLFQTQTAGLHAFYYAGQGRVLGTVPMQFGILLGVAVLAAVLLHRTRFGLRAYACGGSARAAHLTGVPVARIQTIAFILSGVLAAIAGLLGLAFIQSVTPIAGQGVEFDVFAAAVLGGASLFGGEGTIWGAVLGAALLGVLRNGLLLLNVSAFWQIVAIGLVTILAILVNKIVTSRRLRSRT